MRAARAGSRGTAGPRRARRRWAPREARRAPGRSWVHCRNGVAEPMGSAERRAGPCAWLESAAMGEEALVRLTADPLDPVEALAFCADPGAGGTVLFSGTVRDASDAGQVTGLDYEAWAEAAGARLAEIAEEI